MTAVKNVHPSCGQVGCQAWGLGDRVAELTEALHDARLQLEYLSEKFGETGTGNTVLARINSVLAR